MPMPTSDDFTRNRVTNPNQSEIVRQRLYDFQLYPTAGQTLFTFFSLPVGSGITSALGATVGTSKTFADTNMRLGGQLPNGQGYMVESVEVFFMPGAVATTNTFLPALQGNFEATAADAAFAAWEDVNRFRNAGYLEFNILSKNYLRETPMLAFPCKADFMNDGAVASNGAATGASYLGGLRSAGRPYYVEPMIALQANMNFEITINFPGAVATPSGFNARVGVILDGYMYRASQ